MKRFLFVVLGAVFGFLLSRSRASDYAAIAGMFRFTDLHLFGVIGVAIATAALGLFALRSTHAKSPDGAPILFRTKPYNRAVLVGGLIFGVGWALSGACPGTALTQLGEGKLYALATVAGILGGTWLQQRQSAKTQTALPAALSR